MRIKSSDIRIGNLINVKKFDIYIPAEITSGSDIDGINIGKPVAEGIPLTEEWLLKFSFRDFTALGNCFSLETNQIEIILFKTNTPVGVANKFKPDCFYYFFNKVAVIIEYVHQLQNLYFCLTGKELEVINES